MCLATISSWSCNSCTMLMLSRCSQRIKSCDNSIGKLGVIMENAESASRLTVTWSSWNNSGVGCSGSVWHAWKPIWCLQESQSPLRQRQYNLALYSVKNWVPLKQISFVTSKPFTDHTSRHDNGCTLSICWWRTCKTSKGQSPQGLSVHVLIKKPR